MLQIFKKIPRFDRSFLGKVFYAIVGIIAGSYLTLLGLAKIHATSATSITKDTDTDFSQGTLSSTAIVGTGTSATVHLAGISGVDGTTYKRPITITNPSGSPLSNYQVLITLDTATLISAGKLQSNCADIRFNNTDDTTEITNFWVDNCNNASTRIWVKVPAIAASPTQTTIYLYYGNNSAASKSSFTNVFTQPNGITGLAQWLKADSIVGQSDGNALATWADSSSNSINATQGVSGNRPTYKTNIFNGQPAIQFDGISQYMSMTAPVSGSNTSVFVMFKLTKSTAENYFFGRTDNSNSLYGWDDDTKGLRTGTYMNTLKRTDVINTNQIFSTTISSNIATAYFNGVVQSGTGDFIINFTPSELVGYASGQRAFGGYISEVIFYNATLNGSDRASIERYLAAKYSVTLGSAEPSTSIGSESQLLNSSGTWESASDSNAIDTVWNGGWGDGTSGSTAFSATISNVGTNNTIAFAMRVGTSLSALTSASYISLGTASTGTTYTKTKAELDSLGVATGTARYVQVKATFAQSSGTNPSLDKIILYYLADNTAPESNASTIVMSNTNGGNTVVSNAWANSSAPYFSWNAGSDSQSGLKGYCLYLGTDSAGDPASNKGLLGTSPIATAGSTCQFIVSGNSVDFVTSSLRGVTWLTTSSNPYYLIVKAIDNNNNIDTSSVSFHFRFDNTTPTNVSYISCASGNFSSITDMTFNWPTTGGTASSDTGAGLLGWQYQINSTTGTWKGTTTESTLGVGNYIPLTESSYSLTSSQDNSSVVVGSNVVYFRTVDAAGNPSSDASLRTCNLSFGGDAPTFPGGAAVTVTPSSATENSFALSWDAAVPATSRTIASYYWMVNTLPPANLQTMIDNPGTYFASTNTSVSAGVLPAVVRGSNTVYVAVVDDLDNYSPSSYISGTFTLNTSNPDAPKNVTGSDASIKSASLWRAAIGWATPDYIGLGNLLYTIQRSTDGTTWTTVGTSTGNSYLDTTPTSSRFYWRVGTQDSNGNTISSPVYSNSVTLIPKGSYTSAADLTSGPDVSDITTKKAKITWSTSRNSDSKVAYGTETGKYFDEEPSNSTQSTNHTINLINLNPGTTYYYKVKWTDEDGNTGESGEKNFSTASAPVIKEVKTTNISLSSALIDFTSIHADKVKIYYGKSTNFGGVQTVSTSTSESSYTAKMTDLDDGTKYYYRLNGFDSEGTEYTGDIYSFETLPRPKVSNIQLEQVAGTAETTILVKWLSNTEISSVVKVTPEQGQSRDFIDLTLKNGEHSMIVSGLLPQTQYSLLITGNDKAGNEAVSSPIPFTTASDTRPPTIINLKVIGGTIPPVGFAAGTINAQMVVTWDTDEPATSQVEYGEGTGSEYSSKSQEDGNLTTNHVVVISGLTPSQVYHLRAVSLDAAKNDGHSVDTVTIAPKATRSALDLVVANLSQIFGNLHILNK